MVFFDITVACVVFSEENVLFLLISEFTELWEAITVWCKVMVVLFKLVAVFSTGLAVVAVFLVSLVVDLQVVLLLGAEVGVCVDDLLCMLVESR